MHEDSVEKQYFGLTDVSNSKVPHQTSTHEQYFAQQQNKHVVFRGDITPPASTRDVSVVPGDDIQLVPGSETQPVPDPLRSQYIPNSEQTYQPSQDVSPEGQLAFTDTNCVHVPDMRLDLNSGQPGQNQLGGHLGQNQLGGHIGLDYNVRLMTPADFMVPQPFINEFNLDLNLDLSPMSTPRTVDSVCGRLEDIQTQGRTFNATELSVDKQIVIIRNRLKQFEAKKKKHRYLIRRLGTDQY